MPSSVACLWRQARDELIMTCWKKPNKQKNATPNKRAWLSFYSQSNGKATSGLLMMRKSNISSGRGCSESRGRGRVMTRLVRDHLACSDRHSLGPQGARIWGQVGSHTQEPVLHVV